MGRVSFSEHRVLLIGRDVGAAAEHLKSRNPASLSVVEMDKSALEGTRRHCGTVRFTDETGNGLDFASGSFDAIVASGLLERVRRPEHFLKRLHDWLVTGGRLITAIRTVRSLPIVEGILAGRWLAGGDVAEACRPIRYYTLREVEKLLYRAGFAAELVEPFPGPGHRAWVAQNRPGRVSVGQLAVDGLSPGDAEEFYSRGFLLEAVRVQDVGFGLTSIIIVTFNELDYTRQCVESIRRLTDEPYELIFVDNASTDGTVQYLQSQPDAKVIRNSDNRGFPAAVNQGIAPASGSQVLLLNNDTIVTTGWLRRLLLALHGDAKIGLVGPCSNFVGSEQQIEVGYESPTGLDAFAWEWGKTNDAKLVESTRLIGFCLLIRREVIETVGQLDERFGVGCFEDDDYCLRAIKAGWRAVIAQDAFVHHFGGRTLVANGFDLAAILRENGRRFRDKWGLDSRESDPPAHSLPAPSKRPISFSAARWHRMAACCCDPTTSGSRSA